MRRSLLELEQHLMQGVLADVQQLITEAVTHQFLVLAVAISPNGTRVVTASWDVPTRSLPRSRPYLGRYFSWRRETPRYASKQVTYRNK
jgi:hypothetical protein